jgi:hypothetical protein
MKNDFSKNVQSTLQKTITWIKKLSKRKQEWEVHCWEVSLWRTPKFFDRLNYESKCKHQKEEELEHAPWLVSLWG